MIWIACVVVSQLHAQSVFNVLDSTSSVHGSLLITDSIYYASSRTYNALGESKVVLHKYNLSGQEVFYDTLLTTGVSYNGFIGSHDGKIILFNGYNEVPPYNSGTGDCSIHFKSPLDFVSESSVTYNYVGQQLPSTFLFSDSSFFLGLTNYVSNNGDFCVIKTDTLGNVIWENSYGTVNSDRLSSICLTNDNKLLLGGDRKISGSNWNLVLIKMDLEGDVIWEKEYGQGLTDYNGISIQLRDHSFIVYHGISDGITTVGNIDKLDGNGELLWSKAFPYNDYSAFDYATPYEDVDGTIVVCQTIKNSSNKAEAKIMRLSPTGDIIWEKNYLTRPDKSQYINSIKPTEDGGIIAGGSAFPVGSNTQHTWLIKTNCNGEDGVQYPVTGAPCDQYDCTLYPIDANFTASATTIDLADGGIINFENNSANTTSRVWNFGDGNVDYTDSIIPHTFTQVGIYEVQLIVYHGMCSDTVTQTIEVINTTGIEDLLLETGMNIYPNPNQGDFTIRFKNAFEGQVNVLDLMGRNYRTIAVTKESLFYEMSNLPKGVYVVELVMKNGRREVKRMEVL